MHEPIALLSLSDPLLERLVTLELKAMEVTALRASDTPLSAEPALCIHDGASPHPAYSVPTIIISPLPEQTFDDAFAVLPRPFSVKNFREICKAALAKQPAPISPAPPAEESSPELPLPPVLLPGTTTLFYRNEQVTLTTTEATVYRALSEANGAPVSRTALSELLGSPSQSNLPNVHVCAIRRKLAPLGADLFLRTVRGQGYVLLKTPLPGLK